jgi:hypothetical protein
MPPPLQKPGHARSDVYEGAVALAQTPHARRSNRVSPIEPYVKAFLVPWKIAAN